MSRLSTMLSVLFVVLLSVFGLFLWFESSTNAKVPGGRGKFTLSKETTYVTEPVDAKGYPDYVAAINARMSKGVTPENNANVLIWKALGPHPEGSNLCPEFFQALGIAAPPEKGDYFRELSKFLKDDLKIGPEPDKPSEFYDKLSETIDTVTCRPWLAKDHPEFEKWLKANEKPLSVIAEAGAREQFYNPLIPQSAGKPTPGLIGALLPAVQKCRELATARSGAGHVAHGGRKNRRGLAGSPDLSQTRTPRRQGWLPHRGARRLGNRRHRDKG